MHMEQVMSWLYYTADIGFSFSVHLWHIEMVFLNISLLGLYRTVTVRVNHVAYFSHSIQPYLEVAFSLDSGYMKPVSQAIVYFFLTIFVFIF